MEDKIFNLLIMDITMLSYRGDHIICDSFPINLKVNLKNYLNRKMIVG